MPSMFSISCLPLSMVNLIMLWSKSCDIEGSIAQSLNVSSLQAVLFAKDRSITEGRSPSWQVRCVISPFLFSIE